MALVICIFIIILSNDQLNFSTSTPPSEFHFHLLKEGGSDDFVIIERKWNLCNFTFIEKSSYRNHGTKFDFITTIVLRTRAKIWKLYCKLTINRQSQWIFSNLINPAHNHHKNKTPFTHINLSNAMHSSL